jgi:hypothetical protein
LTFFADVQVFVADHIHENHCFEVFELVFTKPPINVMLLP